MMQLPFATSLALVALTLAACGTEDDGVPESLVDSGQVERVGTSGLRFDVTANACLSSSCDLDRRATCTVTRSGDVILITSRFGWVSGSGDADQLCTADCSELTATCSLDEALPDGTYTVRHGDDEATLVVEDGVPGDLCFGDASFSGCPG